MVNNQNQVTVGDTIYLVSPQLLRRIKQACKIAGIPWQSIAARPSEAEAFCNKVERYLNAFPH
jgi:putative aminopeptidase FrvX